MTEPVRPKRWRAWWLAGALALGAYASCWALGMVYVPASVVVQLPRDEYPGAARAALSIDGSPREGLEKQWPAPLPHRINFDWHVSGGFLTTFWGTLGDWETRIEIQGCEPLRVCFLCTPWEVRAPDFTVFGGWGASYTKRCSAEGEASCPSAK